METIENIYASMFREYDDIQAARGCNQYKHVPGCPDADGSEESKKMTYTQKVDLLKGKIATVFDKKSGKTYRYQVTYDDATAVISWGKMGVDDEGRFYFYNNGDKYVFDDKSLTAIVD